MPDSVVLVERDGSLGRLTLNRPDAGNAIDTELAAAFADAAIALTEDPEVRVILISGSGRRFGVGGDLAALYASDRPTLTGMAHRIHQGFEALARSEKLVVTAAHGVVAGGANGFVLVSDLAVVGESTTFHGSYLGVGLTPDCGVSNLLPRAIGVRRAKHVLIGGRVMTAAEALDWGMVEEVVPDDQVLARAEVVARSLADAAWPAAGRTAAFVDRSWLDGFVEHLAIEAASLGEMRETAASEARIQAFLARSAHR